MLRILKEWLKDYNEGQKALHDSGVFFVPLSWGHYYIHCVNKDDDRPQAVSTNHRHSKKSRQV